MKKRKNPEKRPAQTTNLGELRYICNPIPHETFRDLAISTLFLAHSSAVCHRLGRCNGNDFLSIAHKAKTNGSTAGLLGPALLKLFKETGVPVLQAVRELETVSYNVSPLLQFIAARDWTSDKTSRALLNDILSLEFEENWIGFAKNYEPGDPQLYLDRPFGGNHDSQREIAMLISGCISALKGPHPISSIYDPFCNNVTLLHSAADNTGASAETMIMGQTTNTRLAAYNNIACILCGYPDTRINVQDALSSPLVETVTDATGNTRRKPACRLQTFDCVVCCGHVTGASEIYSKDPWGRFEGQPPPAADAKACWIVLMHSIKSLNPGGIGVCALFRSTTKAMEDEVYTLYKLGHIVEIIETESIYGSRPLPVDLIVLSGAGKTLRSPASKVPRRPDIETHTTYACRSATFNKISDLLAPHPAKFIMPYKPIAKAPADRTRYGCLEADEAFSTFWFGGEPYRLGKKQHARLVLECMCSKNAVGPDGKYVSREDLIDHIRSQGASIRESWRLDDAFNQARSAKALLDAIEPDIRGNEKYLYRICAYDNSLAARLQ